MAGPVALVDHRTRAGTIEMNFHHQLKVVGGKTLHLSRRTSGFDTIFNKGALDRKMIVLVKVSSHVTTSEPLDEVIGNPL